LFKRVERKEKEQKKERNENEQLPPTEHVISSVHNIADRPKLRITELPPPSRCNVPATISYRASHLFSFLEEEKSKCCPSWKDNSSPLVHEKRDTKQTTTAKKKTQKRRKITRPQKQKNQQK
jgi:hypothetical protein